MTKQNPEWKFETTVLPNGFTIVTDSNLDADEISMQWTLRAGSRHGEKYGAGHFFEHLLADGNSFAPDFKLKEIGKKLPANISLFTSKDQTTFGFTSVPDYAGTALEFISQAICGPLFTTDAIEEERRIIRKEYFEYQFNLTRIDNDHKLGHLYGKTGLGSRIIGSLEDIKAMTPKDLIKYYHDNYRAGSMIMAVSGPVNHQQIVEQLAPYFEALPSGIAAFLHQTIRQNQKAPLTLQLEAEKISLCLPHLGHQGAQRKYIGKYCQLLTTYLNDTLREQGDVYHIDASHWTFAETGFVDIGFVSESEEIPSIVRKIEEILESEAFLNEAQFKINVENGRITDKTYGKRPENRTSSTVSRFVETGKIMSFEDSCVYYDQDDFSQLIQLHRTLGYKEASIIGVGPLHELPDFKVKAQAPEPNTSSIVLGGPVNKAFSPS